METWRLISDGPRSGPENMALDESLWGSAADGGLTTLRFYTFNPPAVTIGRSQQPEKFLDQASCAREGVDVARRPTGGLAILHLSDLTYCLTAPLAGQAKGARDRYFTMVGRGLIAGLNVLGIEAAIAAHHWRAGGPGWCFDREFGVDLEWRSRKICGSAQRISSASVLQHGSLFLKENHALAAKISREGTTGSPSERFVALCEAAERPVEYRELAEALVEGFASGLGVVLEPGETTGRERRTASELLDLKYSEGPWGRSEGS